jgi:hypothetical protein
VGGGVVAVVVVVVLVLVFVVKGGNSGQSWTLIAPTQAGGLSRNDSPGVSSVLSSSIGEVRTQFNSMANVGHIKSVVDAVYNLNGSSSGSIPNLIIYVGLNGTFNSSEFLQNMQAGNDTFPQTSAGPHGGTAGCGVDSSGDEGCFWVTGSTLGFLVVEPNGAEARASLDGLMIKMRGDLEKPAS